MTNEQLLTVLNIWSIILLMVGTAISLIVASIRFIRRRLRRKRSVDPYVFDDLQDRVLTLELQVKRCKKKKKAKAFDES